MLSKTPNSKIRHAFHLLTFIQISRLVKPGLRNRKCFLREVFSSEESKQVRALLAAIGLCSLVPRCRQGRSVPGQEQTSCIERFYLCNLVTVAAIFTLQFAGARRKMRRAGTGRTLVCIDGIFHCHRPFFKYYTSGIIFWQWKI